MMPYRHYKIMYKAQFKSKTPFESWTTAGSFGTEPVAISAAIRKKRSGAILVRVIDSKGRVVYTA